MRFAATLDGETYLIEVTRTQGLFSVRIGEETWNVDARLQPQGICSLLIGGVSYVADVKEEDRWFLIELAGETYRIQVEEETRHVIRTRGGVETRGGAQTLAAPMPGKVVRIEVEAGQNVEPGDGLIVIEAMKMENEFRATAAGTVKEVRVQVGQAVNAGDVLIVVE